MKKIILNRVNPKSKNYKKFSALVDDEDFERVSGYNWFIMPNGYVATRIGKSKVYLHRFIMGLTGIDHKNNNKLDNQKNNLRKATKQQNNWNKPKYKTDTSSKFKGVSWCNRGNRWRSKIFHNGKAIYIGTHKDETEAAKAYNKRAKELFGEFAYLNVV